MRDDRITASPPPRPLTVGPDVPYEFVIVAAHAKTGRAFPPFLVAAADEDAARRLCQRNYLALLSITRYAAADGIDAPRRLPYGPPISDKDFEDWYSSQKPDRPPGPSETSVIFYVLGWMLCGPLGGFLGWHLGRTAEERQE